MPYVVLDAPTLQKLGRLESFVEVRDETGKVLGWFAPCVDGMQLPKALRPKISQEEIERRSREGGGRPLADIMADLEKRV